MSILIFTTPDTSYTIRQPDELDHLARIKADFKYFVYWVVLDAVLGGRDTFHPNLGFDLLCEYCEAISDGDLKRSAIMIPPRNFKSVLVSIAMPLWNWLTSPETTYLSISHHDAVLESFMNHRKAIYQHPDYQRCKDFDLTTCTKDTVRNNKSGHILSMVLEFIQTGLGAKVILVDDPIPAKHADNLKHCDKIWELYTGTLLSRLDDKKNGSICVISQRLSEADIVGRVVDIGYTPVKIQAIADKDTDLVFPISGNIWHRKEGDILNPNYEPFETLMEIKKANERSFAAQFQQSPVCTGDGTFEFASFATYAHPRAQYDEVVLSCDTASSVGKDSANWALGVFGKYLHNGFTHLDLLHCHAGKYLYPQGRTKIVELIERFKVGETLIEDKSTGLSLIPSLIQEGYKIIPIKPIKSKVDRAMSCASFIESGRLRIPDNQINPQVDRWLTYWNYELVGFPYAKTRDLLDMTTQVINFYGSKNFDARRWYGV